MKGTVKFFSNAKNFGFIIGEDGKDYFFHRDSVKDEGCLESGISVMFTVQNAEKGLKALNVSLA